MNNTPAPVPPRNLFKLGDENGPGGSLEIEEGANVTAPAILDRVFEQIKVMAAQQGMAHKLKGMDRFSSEPVAKAVLIAAAGHIALLERQIAALVQTGRDQEARLSRLESGGAPFLA